MEDVISRRRAEHMFFTGMALILLGYLSLGFWKSYLGAGVVLAPLPSLVVHVHAVLFVGWFVLFGIQIALVGGDRLGLHRRLGVIMLGWGAAMLISGVATAVMAVRRPASGVDAAVFAGDLSAMIGFAILAGAGLYRRSSAPKHKRLMTLASSAIVGPAIVRWPFDFIRIGPPVYVSLFYLLLPMLIVAYDVATTRRVYGVTWLGLGLMVALVASFLALPALPGWIAFTDWVRLS